MTRHRIELATVILWLAVEALATPSAAVAQAPVWAFADAKRQYQDSADAAGPNYDRIPVLYRERALRSELAYTACVATYSIGYGDDPRWTMGAIRRKCVDTQPQWGQWLDFELRATGAFPPVYFGQTAIALLHVTRVHRVIRFTLRELTPSDAKTRMVLRKYVVPALVRELRKAQKAHELPPAAPRG